MLVSKISPINVKKKFGSPPKIAVININWGIIGQRLLSDKVYNGTDIQMWILLGMAISKYENNIYRAPAINIFMQLYPVCKLSH